MTRAIDPRRLARPLRLLVLAAVLVFAWVAATGFDVVRLPSGEQVLFDLPAGKLVLVVPASGDDVEAGTAVLFASALGRVEYARLVARAGDALELDARAGRARAGAGPWLPLPADVAARLPLQRGEVLVLAENPARRDVGAVVPTHAVRARIVTALPF